MGFIKFVLWTSCAIAIGVGLASWEVDGRTPLEHAKRAMRQPSGLDHAKDFAEDAADSVGEAIETAKDKLGARNPGAPHERHSDEDRQAVDQLISQRSKKK